MVHVSASAWPFVCAAAAAQVFVTIMATLNTIGLRCLLRAPLRPYGLYVPVRKTWREPVIAGLMVPVQLTTTCLAWWGTSQVIIDSSLRLVEVMVMGWIILIVAGYHLVAPAPRTITGAQFLSLMFSLCCGVFIGGMLAL